MDPVSRCRARRRVLAIRDSSQASLGPTVMVAQAARRNATALSEQRLHLHVARVETLPDLGGPFDAVLAVNTIGFWPDPLTRLRELHELLVPGGRMAITVQPRSKGATAETSVRVGAQLQAQLHETGFKDERP